MKRAIAEQSGGMRYLTKPPLNMAPDRVLAHNQISHTIDMDSGENGFRFWTVPQAELPQHFKLCKCGWSGQPHYRARSDDKRIDARCVIAALRRRGLIKSTRAIEPRRRARHRSLSSRIK
jgi:hypothetical protein